VLTVNQFFTAGRVVSTSDLLTVLPSHFVNVTGIADQLAIRELPLAMQPVHVDALWHRRQNQRSDHAWLRLAVAASAQQAFGTAVRG
jgi:DNA-binding transcriptional LysR family regulator